MLLTDIRVESRWRAANYRVLEAHQLLEGVRQKALGVDSIQGYSFSQALSPREFEHRFPSRGRATGVALDVSVWDRL